MMSLNTTPHLSPCQRRALDVLEKSADNVFLTGSAGTGKSFLIRRFLKDKDRKIFPIVASTGVAAILVGGRTFHSFFGLGIMEGGFDRTVERAVGDRRLQKRLRGINGFVLDEVSMIPGAALRAAETICRRVRQKHLPWGGARVVAVGDFSQLPPVSREGEEREWAFLDESWGRSEFTPIVLKTIQRTEDEDFIRVLNFIRHGTVNDDVRNYLAGRTDPDGIDRKATFLFPTRDMAERYNLKCLAAIDAPQSVFDTDYSGPEYATKQLKKNAPIPEILKIKKSARVMIRINDPTFQYVNGTIGTVEDVSPNLLVLKLVSGKVVELSRHSFALMDAEGKEIAHANNFPVNLAYAMTIHKSQGTTLDHLVADLRRLWEPGQAYVALSRLRSGVGLTLTGWDEASIKADPAVMAFHESLG